MSCKFSGKAFNRGFNLRRHENEYCPLRDQEREMSETESQAMKSGDNAFTSSTDGSESPMTTDNETETEEEENAYSSILPKLQKELENIYIECLMWMQQLKNDPVHKKKMQTRDAFMHSDNFDPEEAMEAAVDKRKFLIKRLLRLQFY